MLKYFREIYISICICVDIYFSKYLSFPSYCCKKTLNALEKGVIGISERKNWSLDMTRVNLLRDREASKEKAIEDFVFETPPY